MFETHNQTIQRLLIQTGATPAQLEAATAEQAATGKALADVAVDLGLVTRVQLLGLVAAHLGGEWLEQAPVSLAGDTIALIPAELARTYGVIPLRVEGRRLELLAVDPLNARIVEDLTFALGCDIRLVVADPLPVGNLIRRYYGQDETSAEKLLGEIHAEEFATSETGLTPTAIETMAGQAPIIRFVNLVLGQAIRDRASDIHFEPFEHEFKIRYRIDGTLYEMTPPARQLALPITSRLKVMANLNIAERRVPQDGRIRLTLAGRAVDLRVSTLPTQFGESVVLRVLDQSAVQLELDQLGLPADVRAGLEATVRRPNGIFIATGPTGSGKTTTLYCGLRLINDPELKLLTAEDPVEYEIEGIMQVPVNAAIGLTFATALRAFLRQDPDVIMVGEIRDLETAQVAIQASLTGHLVFSTLHTNDAVGTVIRLLDMGVEPFLIASTLEAVLAQRLVRRICRHCRVPFAPAPAMLEQAGIEAALASRPFYRGGGCDHCNRTGYHGRMGLFEWLPMTDPLRELVMQKAPAQVLRQQAAVQGMRTLREDGLRGALAGETTLDEVIRFT
jgi:type IV pilus assembly protein PilB